MTSCWDYYLNRAWTYALTAALVATPVSGQNLDATAELMRALSSTSAPPPGKRLRRWA